MVEGGAERCASRAWPAGRGTISNACREKSTAGAAALINTHRSRPPTHELNEVIHEAVAAAEPPLRAGKRARFYYATAVGSRPPTIALFVNQPELVTTSYLRYLENRLRAVFPLAGTPLDDPRLRPGIAPPKYASAYRRPGAA